MIYKYEFISASACRLPTLVLLVIEIVCLASIKESLSDWEQITLGGKLALSTTEQCKLVDEKLAAVARDFHLIYWAVEIVDDVACLTSVVSIATILTPAEIAEVDITILVSHFYTALTDVVCPCSFLCCSF